MKKIVTLFISAVFFFQLVSGQKPDTTNLRSPQALHDFYMHRFHTKKTVAIVCLSGGIVVTAVGLLIAIENTVSAGSGNNTGRRGIGLSNIGFLTTLASIPLFISAGSSRRKARLALRGESVSFGNKTNNKFNYTAIAFTISL